MTKTHDQTSSLPLADVAIVSEVTAIIQKMGECFTDIHGPQPITLFDPDEPAPQYLGEEMDDWMIGWDALKWYFETPERFAMIDAMDYHPSNIRVRSLTDEMVLATWDVHAEMKFRHGAPLGERLRANAIMRNTSNGWRFIYYAEAPKSAMAYMQDLYANMASPEFKARFAAGKKLTDPPSDPRNREESE